MPKLENVRGKDRKDNSSSQSARKMSTKSREIDEIFNKTKRWAPFRYRSPLSCLFFSFSIRLAYNSQRVVPPITILSAELIPEGANR